MLKLLIISAFILGQADREADWKAASDHVVRGDLTIAIAGARVGQVPLKRLGEVTLSKEELLSVVVAIHNASETKKYDYRGWSTKDFDRESRLVALAFDNLGNQYKRTSFDSLADVESQLKEGSSVYPEKVLTDVLVFEVPVNKAAELRVLLPGEALGMKDPIRLKVRISAKDEKGWIYTRERAKAEREAEDAQEVRQREVAARKAEAERQNLAEAKKTPEQKVAEKKKADDARKAETERKAKAIADEKAERDEKAATSKMKAADGFLSAGKPEAYRKSLREIVEKYPDTPTGKKAAKLLK